MYYHILEETNFKIAFTVHLPSWRTGLKQVNIQNLTICVKNNEKYIYINLIIGYGNETVKFVITMKFLGVQIDNNISSYVSVDIVRHALPWWQLQG